MFEDLLSDMREKLLKMVKGEDMCEGCSDAKYSVVSTLSADETREWVIIMAETKRIIKETEKISKEKEILNARKKMFIGKIQLHSNEIKSKLIIKNGKALKVECSDNCSPLSSLLPPPPFNR